MAFPRIVRHPSPARLCTLGLTQPLAPGSGLALPSVTALVLSRLPPRHSSLLTHTLGHMTCKK